MAERRMMTKKVIHSDAFLDMPTSTQNLYFHLLLEGDDEGFVNSPKKVQRMIGAGDDDAAILIAKKFIISFESGVIVIKHWKMHNYIQRDRFKETTYTDERAKLSVNGNKSYSMDTECIQDVRVGKGRLGEVSIEEARGEEATPQYEIVEASHSMVSATKVSEYLRTKILSVSPDPKMEKKNISSWAKDVDKAIRLDGRTEKELIACIDWMYTTERGSFWVPNVLSGYKLREKFHTMKLQSIKGSSDKQTSVDKIYDAGLTASEMIKEMEKRQ